MAPEHVAALLADNGLGSRKFLLSLLALVLISGIALASAHFISIQSIYPAFVGGIVSVLGIFVGGNQWARTQIAKSINPPN